MNVESGIEYFNKHKQHLFVPFIGIGMSTYSRYSILSQQPLEFALLKSLAFCLISTFLIYAMVFLANAVDGISAKLFHINVSWIFGVALIALFIARVSVNYVQSVDSSSNQKINLDEIFRLISGLLIGLILIQLPTSRIRHWERKSKIKTDDKNG